MSVNTFQVSELEKMILFFGEEVDLTVLHEKKLEYAKAIIEFIEGSNEIFEMVNELTFDTLFRAVVFMNYDLKLDIARNRGCLKYLKCLRNYRDFFSSRLPSFLSAKTKPFPFRAQVKEVTQLFVPLCVEDACIFMNMVSENLLSLRGCNALSIIVLFTAAARQGLLDHVIAVLDESVSCSPSIEIPSEIFPYPASETSELLIKYSFQTMLSCLKTLENREDVEGVDCVGRFMCELRNQFFGRLIIAKEGNLEKTERRK